MSGEGAKIGLLVVRSVSDCTLPLGLVKFALFTGAASGAQLLGLGSSALPVGLDEELSFAVVADDVWLGSTLLLNSVPTSVCCFELELEASGMVLLNSKVCSLGIEGQVVVDVVDVGVEGVDELGVLVCGGVRGGPGEGAKPVIGLSPLLARVLVVVVVVGGVVVACCWLV